MISPLQAFMSEVCGATPSVTIVSDNAVAPAYTLSQERQERSFGLPLKPTRPNRIAAKGISYLASALPPELELALRPSLTKTANDARTGIPDVFTLEIPSATILGELDSSFEESASCLEEMVVDKSSRRKSKATSLRVSHPSTTKSHRAKSHVRLQKIADKVVAAAFAA